MATNTRVKAPTFTTGKGVFKYPKLSAVDFGNKEFPKKDGEYSTGLVARADEPWLVDLLAKLEPLHQQAIANGETAFKALKAEQRKKLGSLKVNALVTEILDPDTEEPTGEVSFKFSQRASGEYQNGKKTGQFWDTRPTIFGPDAKVLVKGFRFRDREDGEEITDVHVKAKPEIWGGTVGKVSFEVGLNKDQEPGYFIAGTGTAGLKLSLTAVQVIELVEGGQKDASSYGFGDETDGEGTPFDVDETPAASNGDF